MSEVGRRQFISGAIGVAAVAGSLGGSSATFGSVGEKTPLSYRTFSATQAETYATWCDLLANGAAQAGVARFVDKYISESYSECLLLLRFFKDSSLGDFYLAGIGGIDRESNARFRKPFVSLGRDEQLTIIEAAKQRKTQAWTEPDPNFFYFISRSDAVDVVYGTELGFRDLDFPYLAHIAPAPAW